MYPHPIRLRGPWKCEAIGDEGVRYCRSFHRPSNLDPHERLWLVCEGFCTSGRLNCNGQPLGDIPVGLPAAYEITTFLQSQNTVLIDLASNDAGLGDVRLEVRERQFLDPWRLWIEHSGGQPTLRLEAHLAGEPLDEPLELIVRGSDGELMYAHVTAGSNISLSEPLAALGHEMRFDIRLLRGGTRIWEAHQRVGGEVR